MATYTPYTINDILTFVCNRVLIEPVVNTTLGTTVAAPGTFTITPPSMAAIYDGAMLLVGQGADFEVVTASDVNQISFQATFVNAHPSTDPLYGATFPTGQPSDILFTQAEMIDYLIDALYDFQLKVRPVYNILAQQFIAGQRTYQTPADALRIERISRVDYNTLGTAVPAPGVYTITPPTMFGIYNGLYMLVGIQGTNLETVTVSNVTATTFQATFQYTHTANDPLYPAGIYRLWDVSITNLDQNNPNWQAETGKPRMFYEDQLNVGYFGVYPLSVATFINYIWYSQRTVLDTASYSVLLDSPLGIADPLAYIPYYGMLARVFRKDGEMRDPQREQFCQQKYDMGVEIVRRLLEAIPVDAMPGPPQMQGARPA